MTNDTLYRTDTASYEDTALALRQTDISGLAAFVALHPDTAPEAIYRTHRDLILGTWFVFKDVEEISNATCLPCSIVRRHLIELGFLARPRPRKARYRGRSGQPLGNR